MAILDGFAALDGWSRRRGAARADVMLTAVGVASRLLLYSRSGGGLVKIKVGSESMR
jgi:hypothetical protein